MKIDKKVFGKDQPKPVYYLVDVGKDGQERVVEMSMTAIDYAHFNSVRKYYEEKKGFKGWVGLTRQTIKKD